MFLNQLVEDSKKELFLSLATLVMMASDSSNRNVEEDAKDDTLKVFSKIKTSLSSQDVLLKRLFDNIQATEAQMLKEYMQELNHKYWVSDGCAIGCTTKNLENNVSNLTGDSVNIHTAAIGLPSALMLGTLGLLQGKKVREEGLFAEGDKVYLLNLLKVYSTQVMTETFTFEEKESDKNLPYLLRSGMRLYVLKNVASVIIKGNTEAFSTKERKIILTELIGAGFSSGHFEEEEKELVQFIGSELGLDEEYFDEITEAMEKVFIANRELTELVYE